MNLNSIFIIISFYSFSLCCFGEAITIKVITSEAIDTVEKFVQNELENILNEWKLDGEMIHDVDFYGTYHSKRNFFNFLVGERALILELKTYVQNIIERETFKYFSKKSAEIKKKGRKLTVLDFSGTFQLKDGKRLFTKTNSLPASTMIRTDDLKKRLHDNLRNLLISNGAQEDILRKFNEDQAVVENRKTNK